jgi:hypothetical protein
MATTFLDLPCNTQTKQAGGDPGTRGAAPSRKAKASKAKKNESTRKAVKGSSDPYL